MTLSMVKTTPLQGAQRGFSNRQQEYDQWGNRVDFNTPTMDIPAQVDQFQPERMPVVPIERGERSK